MLCGPPGSGKGVVAECATARGLAVLSLGDVVRTEMVERGLPETPENVGQTALAMREEHGEVIVVDRLMPRLAEAMESSDVLIDGMRQPEELERLREHIGDVTIVALSAPAQTRAEWLAERGRGEDGEAAARGGEGRRGAARCGSTRRGRGEHGEAATLAASSPSYA